MKLPFVVRAPKERARSLPDSEPFELESRELVGELLAQVRRVRPPLTIVQGDLERAATVAEAPAGDADLTFTTADDFAGDAPAMVRLRLHEAPFRVDGLLQRLDAGRFRLTGARLFSLDQRAAQRLTLVRGDATLDWTALVGGDLATTAVHVEELSSDGVGLSLPPEVAPPPLAPFAATLHVDARAIPCLAETRYLQKSATGTRVGLRLRTRATRMQVVDSYLRRRFPQLHPRREIDPDKVYDLLDDSGYLDLRADMRPPRRWFQRDDDDAISRDVCYRARDGALIGHVSFTRAYPRAWLGHQLATIRDHEEAIACRRAIYLHIASYPTLVDGEEAMMVGYFDAGRPWHRRFFSGFVDWLRLPELAVTYGLDRFERDPAERPPAVIAPGAEVGMLRDDEVVTATALVRGQLPPLIADVLDIHPERLVAPRLNEDYRQTRYRRGRSVLALREHGRLAGVALLETGSRELSIFNLFNMAQLFVVTGQGRPSTAAQLMLLGAVREFYRARGEANPMVVAPPDTVDAAQEPGTFHAEVMGMIAWSGRALRQYENYLNYEFGKLSSIEKREQKK